MTPAKLSILTNRVQIHLIGRFGAAEKVFIVAVQLVQLNRVQRGDRVRLLQKVQTTCQMRFVGR